MCRRCVGDVSFLGFGLIEERYFLVRNRQPFNVVDLSNVNVLSNRRNMSASSEITRRSKRSSRAASERRLASAN